MVPAVPMGVARLNLPPFLFAMPYTGRFVIATSMYLGFEFSLGFFIGRFIGRRDWWLSLAIVFAFIAAGALLGVSGWFTFAPLTLVQTIFWLLVVLLFYGVGYTVGRRPPRKKKEARRPEPEIGKSYHLPSGDVFVPGVQQ